MAEESKALERAGPQQTAMAGRMTVNQIEEAFKEYLELQNRLDKLMPDEIMKIGKKKFRKKGYWRMVKKWARLTVEIVKEERIETEASCIQDNDWGYLVTARVTTPDGQSEDGDGSCMASEKNVYQKDWTAWRAGGGKGRPDPIKDKDGQPVLDEVETAKNATVHNVRAHAITRAKNRAISDLVGFGEVSAEEINQDREEEKPKPNPQQRADAETKSRAWTFSIWELLKNSGHPDINEVWNRAGAAAKAKSADVATIAQQKKFKESVLSQLDDWRATKDDVPAEEFGKMFVSEEQIEHLRKTAGVANPDLKNDKDLLDYCRGVLKNFDIQDLKHLKFNEYEGVLNILDTRTGDQRHIPLGNVEDGDVPF